MSRAPAAVLAVIAGGETAIACHGDPAPDAHTGTLRSSVTDLLRYRQAHLHPETTPLAAALRDTQIPRVAAKGKDRICLVWNHRSSRHGDVLFHSGGTRGFTAFVGFCPQAGTGVAALAKYHPTPSTQPDPHRVLPVQSPHLGAPSRRCVTRCPRRQFSSCGTRRDTPTTLSP